MAIAVVNNSRFPTTLVAVSASIPYSSLCDTKSAFFSQQARGHLLGQKLYIPTPLLSLRVERGVYSGDGHPTPMNKWDTAIMAQRDSAFGRYWSQPKRVPRESTTWRLFGRDTRGVF